MIICDMCLRSGAGFPDALVMDHDAEFMSGVFRAFVKSMRSSTGFKVHDVAAPGPRTAR